MTKEQLEMLRGWVIVQIEAQINDREEDESGHRITDVREHQYADELFQILRDELS
jgi:hypothetical protein